MLPDAASSQGRRLPNVVLTWYGARHRGAATIGDQYAIENLSSRLSALGVRHAVLSALPLAVKAPVVREPLHLQEIEVLVHVCGPLLPAAFDVDLYRRSRVRMAVGVSLLSQHRRFNKALDAIVVRDGQRPETYDLSLARFATTPAPATGLHGAAPRIGLCVREHQPEYGEAAIFHEKAQRLFTTAIEASGAPTHEIDTVLRPRNTQADIEAAFRRADIIATTRMHGAILGLAFGKPVVAIDQVEGGAKVANLLGRIGWPLVFRGDSVRQADINRAFAMARSPAIHEVVARCRAAAIRLSTAAVEISATTIAGFATTAQGMARARLRA
jgi:hypothetical protein